MTVQPFFLDSAQGKRFHVLHASPTPRMTWLYIPPFGEEMNKSRRMITLLGQALVQCDQALLIPDLAGCGDSAGELREVTQDTWVQDIQQSCQWLIDRYPVPIGLWSLRSGSLTLFKFLEKTPAHHFSCILWQPVLNGAVFLNQFLRLKVAADMALGHKTLTQTLRQQLREGQPLEIAGYELPPPLADDWEHTDFTRSAPANGRYRWFERLTEATSPLPPSAIAAAQQWQAQGLDVQQQGFTGLPFWQTQEITECLPLIQQSLETLPHARD
jgi:hydrolase, ortholog 2, exosortase system type 1 associated